MSEDIPICQIHKKYKGISCTNASLPGDPGFFCILHFQNEEKDKEAFKEALLARWNQVGKEFVNFSGVFFPGPFDPGVLFGSNKFKRRIDFSGAMFLEADFSGGGFEGWVKFDGASFSGKTDFSNVDFTVADFPKASFKGEVIFSCASFTIRAGFSGAQIGGRVVFREINPPDEEGRTLQFNADFSNLEFQENGVLRFQDISLARVRFAGTDLRRLQFHNVIWNHYRGRQVLYDEVLLRQEERENPWLWTWLSSHFALQDYAREIGPAFGDYSDKENLPTVSYWGNKYGEIERLYRDLQINYESVNDYKSSGDFHYGEMEMHRRANRWRLFPFYWYNLYWILSGYGERPSQALGWLAGLLVFLPLLIWLFGLDIAPQGKAPDFWETFSYMFEKAIFQKPEPLSGINGLGKFISNLGLLIIPGQAALFLLALRNRLGRRR